MSYIVPRDKPKRCTRPKCRFMDRDTLDCRLQDKSWESFEEQYEHCPLAEIPTPHGRLIDADKLNTYDLSPVNGFCVMGVTEEDIGLADTVIEAAEGSKE